MQLVQLFMGEKYYPAGGAEDLVQTRFDAVPPDQQLCELFRQFAQSPATAGKQDFWVNACVITEQQPVRIERWLAYKLPAGRRLPEDVAPWVTAQIEFDGAVYSLVPIEKRDQDGEAGDWYGPKGRPDITFW